MIVNNNNLTENRFPVGQSSRWTKGTFDTRISAVLVHPTKSHCFCNSEKQGVGIFTNASIIFPEPFLKISLG
jgi:hypothetical protein